MNELLAEIKTLIVESLELEDISADEIGDDAPLFSDEGLGLDSIDALELGVALRKKYKVQLDKGDSRLREHFRTARTLSDFVQAQLARQAAD